MLLVVAIATNKTHRFAAAGDPEGLVKALQVDMNQPEVRGNSLKIVIFAGGGA